VTVTTPTAWYKFKGEINDVIKRSLKNTIYAADDAFLLQTQAFVSSVLHPHSFATYTFYVTCNTVLIASEFEMHFSFL